MSEERGEPTEDQGSDGLIPQGRGSLRAAFHTFGCKLNQYETESLASALREGGFAVVPPSSGADLYVINTCTVTSRSEQKARRYIRSLSRRHPESLLVVTGCFAQLNREAVQALAENVLVVPQEQKALLLRLPEHLRGGGELRRDEASRWLQGLLDAPAASVRPPDVFDFQVRRFSFHSRAFLKIQDGCDYCCAYCRVPLARGGSVSLPAAEVLERARKLEEGGYREVVLTGVNICAYRHGNVDLAGLLGELLEATGKTRLRLSSLEPERIDERLASVIGHDRVCAHFHLPVQSGSDAVLLRMRRRYRSERVRRAVSLLRRCKDDPFLAADLIAGFPGESEADFLATCALVEELAFAKLHVFPFSPRPGTKALSMSGRVPERIRDGRCERLDRLSRLMHERYTSGWVGREIEVLLESRAGPSGAGAPAGTGAQTWQGLAGNYLRVAVEGLPAGAARAGALVCARLLRAGDPCSGRYLNTL